MRKALLTVVILIGLSGSCFADDTAPSRAKAASKKPPPPPPKGTSEWDRWWAAWHMAI